MNKIDQEMIINTIGCLLNSEIFCLNLIDNHIQNIPSEIKDLINLLLKRLHEIKFIYEEAINE